MSTQKSLETYWMHHVYIYILGWTEIFAIFSCVLVCGGHIMWPKHFKTFTVSTLVGSVEIVRTLTDYALLYSPCDLKTVQVNVKRSLIPRTYALWPFNETNLVSSNRRVSVELGISLRSVTCTVPHELPKFFYPVLEL